MGGLFWKTLIISIFYFDPFPQRLWGVAKLVEDKLKSEGSFDQKELQRMFAEGGLESPSIDLTKLNVKFNDLDNNKDGKIEESEIRSVIEGQDYFYTPTPDFIPQISNIEQYFKH